MKIFKNRKKIKKFGLKNKIANFLRGIVLDIYAYNERIRLAQDSMLITVLFGDMIGLPIPKQIYALILLKYFINRFEWWKRFVLKERDVISLIA